MILYKNFNLYHQWLKLKFRIKLKVYYIENIKLLNFLFRLATASDIGGS
jgi:hypothetical protein